MNSRLSVKLVLFALCGFFVFGAGIVESVMPANAAARGASGLPLPRYVSLKSKRVNMRVGPGTEYQVEWLYLKRGLPMEIIQEFDNWRKVRDPEGNEGWILHSLLSGSRTVIVAPWENDAGENGASENDGKRKTDRMIEMHQAATLNSALVARIEPGVVATVEKCVGGWCRIEAGEAKGFVRQNLLWGVYPDEEL